MKGLILKDLYLLKGFFKYYICLHSVFTVLFAISHLFIENSAFYMVVPCLVTGLVVSSLVSYDEHYRWNRYECSLPVSRTEIVSSKYIMGLLLCGATLLGVAAFYIPSAIIASSFSAEWLYSSLCSIAFISLTSTALIMPFVYKYGAQKGRIVYYISFGAFSALLFGVSTGVMSGARDIIYNMGILLAFFALGVYCLSWLVSARVYAKKDI